MLVAGCGDDEIVKVTEPPAIQVRVQAAPTAVDTGEKVAVQAIVEGAADLAKVEANAQRCKRIVANLLTFARQSRMERQPASLNTVIDSVVNLNEYVFRLDGVEIARDLDARVPPVPVDVGRWQQVFVNLAQNAREAMVDAGSPQRRITFRTRLRADAVEVRVEDTGPGIPPDVAHRIFDPFVTGRASGTGLGLSLVYGIVTGAVPKHVSV